MSNDIPEQWSRRIKQRGYVRERGGGPNLTALARDAGLHTSTVSNALRGSGHEPDARTVAALVRLLGEDTASWFERDKVAEWRPPVESALLTQRQRRAIDEMIRAMVDRREETDDGTATNPAGTGRREERLTVARERGEGRGADPRFVPGVHGAVAARLGTPDRAGFDAVMDAAGEESQDPGSDV